MPLTQGSSLDTGGRRRCALWQQGPEGGRGPSLTDYGTGMKPTSGTIVARRVRELATLLGRIRATEYRLYRLLETSHAT